MDFLKIAKEVLETESSALLDSIKRLDSNELEKIVKLIANAKGKLIVVCVGKI